MPGAVRAWVTGLVGWKRYAFAFFMGVAAALAMAPYYILPLMIVGFTALVWLIDSAARHEKPRRTGFFTAWWFACGYMILSIYWMMLSWMVHAQGPAQTMLFALAGVIGVILLSFYLSVYAGFAGLLASWLWRPGWSRVLVLAGFWGIAEYLRGTMLTGLPWNLPAQALAFSATVSQLSAYIGPYGFSLVVLLLAMLPAAMFSGRPGAAQPSLLPLGGLIAGSVAILLVGFLRVPGGAAELVTNVRVQIVQPSIRQRDKINYEKFADNFMENVALSGGDPLSDLGPEEQAYVIWPENAAYQYLENSTDALDIVTRALPENALLLSGALRMEAGSDGENQFYNSFHVVADVTEASAEFRQAAEILPVPRQRAIIHSYDKHHLVPFGEFVPFEGLIRALGIDKVLPVPGGLTHGKGPATLPLGATNVSPVICYETIFPGKLYPKNNRPDWLLIVTNDAWFGDSAGPSQHLDMARLRAIETGLPIARAANTGISAMIDPYGRVTGKLNLYERGAITSGLPRAIKSPPYARFGEALFLLLLSMTGLAAIMLRRNAP